MAGSIWIDGAGPVRERGNQSMESEMTDDPYENVVLPDGHSGVFFDPDGRMMALLPKEEGEDVANAGMLLAVWVMRSLGDEKKARAAFKEMLQVIEEMEDATEEGEEEYQPKHIEAEERG